MIPELRIGFGLTPLAIPFLALLALVVPAVVTYVARRDRIAQLPLLLLFAASMAAVLLAQTLAAFSLAWEGMTLTSAFLVGTYHERRAVRRALFSYMLVGQISALCVIAALVLLAGHAQSVSFTAIAQASASLSPGLRVAIAALALAGFGAKAGIVPLHFWLPRAHPVAPAAASALLSGAMLKVAIYGLALVCLQLAAPLGVAFAATILAFGLITAFSGALYAALETDFKRLLAFSSIENIGIIASALGFACLAIAARAPIPAAIAIAALLLHSIAHGVFKSLLFLGAGEIAGAARTTDLEHLGGLLPALRYSGPAILTGCFAAAALPPMGSFASEWLLFSALLNSFENGSAIVQAAAVLAVVALGSASGIVAVAFVKAFGISLLGAARSTHPRTSEAFGSTPIALTWLAILTLILGIVSPLALRPLLALVAVVVPTSSANAQSIPAIPVWIAALPVAGGFASWLWMRRTRRTARTWTCGSPVSVRSQYGAMAFVNPLRMVFAALAQSRTDQIARDVAASVQILARRTRIVQAGYVRVYLAYALAALVAILVIAR